LSLIPVRLFFRRPFAPCFVSQLAVYRPFQTLFLSITISPYFSRPKFCVFGACLMIPEIWAAGLPGTCEFFLLSPFSRLRRAVYRGFQSRPWSPRTSFSGAKSFCQPSFLCFPTNEGSLAFPVSPHPLSSVPLDGDLFDPLIQSPFSDRSSGP